MKYKAEIYLPGHGSRILSLAALNESAAWDEARAACSPSERVQEILVDKGWTLSKGYDYHPDKVYGNYQRTVKLPGGEHHITVVAKTLEVATSLAFLIQHIPDLLQTLEHIQHNCDDPAGFKPAAEVLEMFTITRSTLKEVL